MRKIGLFASGLMLLSGSAQALDYQWDDFTFTLNNRATAGAIMRMQAPSYDLLGKINVPGQQSLCEADDCISFLNNPAPNQRLVDAKGAFSGTNNDNGDLNYKNHSIVAATTMLDSDFKVSYQDFLLRVRAIGLYDPANIRFRDNHNVTDYRGTELQPAQTARTARTTNIYARNVLLQDAYLQYSFSLDGHNGTLSVGQQNIRWGESTLVAINSVNEINPPNSALLHVPGGQIKSVFQPVPMALLSFDVADGVSADVVYQLRWKPVQPDAAGSYFSTSDIAGGGEYAVIGLGQFPEDPHQKLTPAASLNVSDPFSSAVLGFISSTAFSTRILPDSHGEPKNSGQYGFKIGYNADWLNGGTDLGFYFLNYHSRFPYASVISTNESCARNAITAVDAAAACGGTFNGILAATKNPANEPAPIDTLKVFLEYPEDIHMFGVSFNTNVGSWSLAGEYSFRPNMPLQVALTDVVFAGLQPALPKNEIDVGVDTLLGPLGINTGLNAIALPSSQQAFPDYLMTRYRGQAVNANQYIPGFQRFKVGQGDFTAIKAFSSNPFAADQIIWIMEAGFTHIYNLPSLERLQIEGGDLNDTHHSPGADGTGNGGVTDSKHFNPTKQYSGFATKFSWGLRSIIQMEYNDVVFGWAFKPQIVLLHDMTGVAPSPNQNFIAGRSQAQVGTDINFTQNLTGHMHYEWYWGGAKYMNALKDRDNMAFALAYSF